MDTYGIVIVTYQPNIHELNLKIKKYSMDKNAEIIIVNNGKEIQEIKRENVKYINLGKNKGIAYAQNIGVDYLISKKIKFSFLLDQDSILPDDYFNRMMTEWNLIKKRDSMIGVLAPIIYDINGKNILVTRHIVNNQLEYMYLKNNFIYNTLPICSGILVDTLIFKNVGGNKNDYFIDWVDFQFDLDVIRYGYHVYQTGNICIDHQIGNLTKVKFLWKTIHPTNHSIFRNYYYFRNGILFIYQNKDFPFVKRFVIKSLIKRYINVFFEEKSLKKHKAQFSGIKDAVKIIRNKNN